MYRRTFHCPKDVLANSPTTQEGEAGRLLTLTRDIVEQEKENFEEHLNLPKRPYVEEAGFKNSDAILSSPLQMPQS